MINKRLILIPQYPSWLRYQEWWFNSIPYHFSKIFKDVITIVPDNFLLSKPQNHEFSPINESIIFESEQIKKFIQIKPTKDDIVLVMDVSFPGFFSNIIAHFPEVPFYGYIHATSINSYDYFVPARCGKRRIEEGQIKLFKKCFVSTKYHKNKLITELSEDLQNRINVIKGLPYNPLIDKFKNQNFSKKYEIISVSRNSEQKVTKDLEDFVEQRLNINIVRKDIKTWSEYYSFLSESKILLITAKEETYGYAAMEAFLMGCIPVVPNNFSYQEIYPLTFRYNDRSDLISTIGDLLDKWIDPRYDERVMEYAPTIELWVETLAKEMLNG